MRKKKVQKQKEGIYKLRINKITLFDCPMNGNVGSTPTLSSLKTAIAGIAKLD